MCLLICLALLATSLIACSNSDEQEVAAQSHHMDGIRRVEGVTKKEDYQVL